MMKFHENWELSSRKYVKIIILRLEDWNHDIDHVHILFNANPNTNISKFINAYKSASSRIIKKELPEIKQRLWKENFWSTSFCLISTGGATIEISKIY